MADETKSGLEELAKGIDVQNGAGTDGKDGVNQPGAGTKEGQQSKGTWISVLPESLRKGVEAEKYANLNEYIQDLQTRANGAVRDDQAFTDGWNRYVEEMESSGTMLPETIQNALKDAKVDAESARKITKAIAEYGSAALQKSEEALKLEMAEYIKANWKDSFEEKNALVKKGISAFSEKHPELARKAAERKGIYSPEFAQLLADYGEALSSGSGRKEVNVPEGGSAPKEDKDNPFGLKHF